MWLADAVAAYVERLTEREFDAPFIALLRHLGYTDVHLTHGQYEFGKDFIARLDTDGVQEQWCFQSKAGNISKTPLRTDVQPQVNLMRVGSVVHPSFDKDLPRRIVVVTTGRLVGSAAVEFQDTENYHRDRGELVAELWDIDKLVPLLTETLITKYDVVTQGRLLELVGRMQSRRGTRADIASLASHWLAPGDTSKEHWRDVLTACLLASTAAQAAREDLAQQALWQVVRAYHRAVTRGDTPDPTILDVVHRALDAIATDFWTAIREASDPITVTLRATGAAGPFVTHPIKIARLCETLSMLALTRMQSSDDDAHEAGELLTFIEDIVGRTPALSHLVGEEWAFSLLVTVTALVAGGRIDTAHAVVREAVVWVLDLLESGILLPPVGATATDVVDRILAANYKRTTPVGTKSGYVFAVLADLIALVTDATPGTNLNPKPDADPMSSDETGDLFTDYIHDLDAFRAMATLNVPAGIETVRHIARIEYAPSIPRANHHKAEASDGWPVASRVESLEIWATFRDRHIPVVLKNSSTGV